MLDDSAVPGTSLVRWLDRQQILYENRRYDFDPIREIQRAWMNGHGLVIWENVFGYWSDYSGRSKSWMRLMLPALRRYADHFITATGSPRLPRAFPK